MGLEEVRSVQMLKFQGGKAPSRLYPVLYPIICKYLFDAVQTLKFQGGKAPSTFVPGIVPNYL